MSHGIRPNELGRNNGVSILYNVYHNHHKFTCVNNKVEVPLSMPLRPVMIIFCLSLLSQGLRGMNVMINEFQNANGQMDASSKMARDEFIEFVIVEATSAAELASMTFGDSNSGTSRLRSVFSFDQATLDLALAGSSLTQFLPGTIIVVKGTALGAQELGYDPYSNTTDSWKIELVAGQGAKDHPSTQIDGSFSLDNNGDVVWISSTLPTSNTDTSGFIHALGYDNAPGVIAASVASVFGSGNILNAKLNNNTAVSNVGGQSVSLVTSTSGSMGVANSTANATWLTNTRLLAIPEPHRAVLIIIGALCGIVRRHRRPLSSSKHG